MGAGARSVPRVTAAVSEPGFVVRSLFQIQDATSASVMLLMFIDISSTRSESGVCGLRPRLFSKLTLDDELKMKPAHRLESMRGLAARSGAVRWEGAIATPPG